MASYLTELDEREREKVPRLVTECKPALTPC